MEGKRWKAEQEWTMSKLYTTGMKYRAGEFLWCDGGHPWCFFVSSNNTKFLLTTSGLALFRWCEVLYNCEQASCCYSLQLLSLVDQLQSTLAEEMSLEDSWSSAEEVSSPAMRTRLGLFLLVSLVGLQFSVHFASSQLAASWAATWPVCSLQELPLTWLMKDGSAVAVWVIWNHKRQGKRRLLQRGCWRKPARTAFGYIPAALMLQAETQAQHSPLHTSCNHSVSIMLIFISCVAVL